MLMINNYYIIDNTQNDSGCQRVIFGHMHVECVHTGETSPFLQQRDHLQTDSGELMMPVAGRIDLTV